MILVSRAPYCPFGLKPFTAAGNVFTLLIVSLQVSFAAQGAEAVPVYLTTAGQPFYCLPQPYAVRTEVAVGPVRHRVIFRVMRIRLKRRLPVFTPLSTAASSQTKTETSWNVPNQTVVVVRTANETCLNSSGSVAASFQFNSADIVRITPRPAIRLCCGMIAQSTLSCLLHIAHMTKCLCNDTPRTPAERGGGLRCVGSRLRMSVLHTDGIRHR